MRTSGAVLAAVTALVAAGCTGGESSAPDSTSRPGAEPTPSSSSTTPASPSPSSKSPSATSDAPANSLNLHLRRSFTTSVATITPQQIKPATSEYSQLPSDQKWWAVKVHSCVKDVPDAQEGVGFTWGAWSITGKDGGTYPASDSTWSDFPRPEYPFDGDRVYLPGQCVQGWVMFALDAKTKPLTIDYGNTVGDVASWRVG